MYKTLKAIRDKEDFIRHAQGPVGTHCLRKFPSTYARRYGCSKDDVDARGRWRKKRQNDTYVDVLLPYPDAKVAALLYALAVHANTGSGVTEQWLRQHVVPHMLQREKLQLQEVLALARPIIWACFDDQVERYMPGPMRNRIRDAYTVIRQLGRS